MKSVLCLLAIVVAAKAAAETRHVYLEDASGTRIEIASVQLAEDQTYTVTMNDAVFVDHFLSMRPFKCLEGPEKHWCHVPYPYSIRRDVSDDLTDLEYDFLFVWKGATEYGINMWNGVYYKLSDDGPALTGDLFEMDMDKLSVPPAAGELRPLRAQDLHQGDPDSHWLPHMIIE